MRTCDRGGISSPSLPSCNASELKQKRRRISMESSEPPNLPKTNIHLYCDQKLEVSLPFQYLCQTKKPPPWHQNAHLKSSMRCSDFTKNFPTMEKALLSYQQQPTKRPNPHFSMPKQTPNSLAIFTKKRDPHPHPHPHQIRGP